MSNNLPDNYIPDNDVVYESALERAREELGVNCNPGILEDRAEQIIREADEEGTIAYDAWREENL